nr:hypothetical protein [uncultured Cohaesibacter sp.]
MHLSFAKVERGLRLSVQPRSQFGLDTRAEVFEFGRLKNGAINPRVIA